MLDTPPILNPLATHAAERPDVKALSSRVAIGVVAALGGALLKHAAFGDGALYIVFLPFTVTASCAGGWMAGVSAILSTFVLVAVLFVPAHGAAAGADPIALAAASLAFAAASLALPYIATQFRLAVREPSNGAGSGAIAPGQLPPIADPASIATVRTQALSEAEELAARFVGVCAAAPGVIFSLSARPDASLACSFVSGKATALFGIDAGELMRDAGSFFEKIHPEDQVSLNASLDDWTAKLEPWQAVFRYGHPEKGEIRIEAHGAPARGKSGGIAWHGFACDVTGCNGDRRRNDELTRQRMSALARSLAHRINQPLTAGTAYLKVAQRLTERLPAGNGAPIDETIGKAIAQVMRAGEVVRDLREFVAHGEPDKTLVSLHVLIEDAVSLVGAQALDADVAVGTRLASRDDQIVADRGQLKQVLVNLLRNAIDAMRSSAHRELRISTAMDDGVIRVEISDTGRGLGGIDAMRLFEPLASADSRTMGIGLSTSRAIVEAHYGSIWAKPNPGGGAVFGLDLPLWDGGSNS